MDRKLINPAIVQDIAAAIREKGGQTEPIVVNALGDAIRALPQGMGDNTTEVVEAISGEQPEGDVEIANAIAKGATDAAREHVWQGERATDEGRELRDGVAFVSALRGKSFTMSQGINADRTIVVPANVSFDRSLAFMPLKANHVYLAFYTQENDCPTSARNLMYYSGYVFSIGGALFNDNQNQKKGIKYSIITPTTDYNGNWKYLGQDIANDVTLSNFQVFDLTAMGWEDVTSPDDFAHRLGYADASSLPYIPYGEQIVNSKPTEVVSRGRNLWDESVIHGYLAANGTFTPNNGYVASDFIEVEPNTLYGITNSANVGRRICYDENKGFISGILSSDSAFITPANTRYLRFDMKGVYGGEYKHDVCLYKGNEATDYAPYVAPSVLPLPLSSILHEGRPLFPNGLCGLGGTTDVVSLARGWAAKGIGVLNARDAISSIRDYDSISYIRIAKPKNAASFNSYAASSSLLLMGYKYRKSPVNGWDSSSNINFLFQSADTMAYWIGVKKGTTLEEAEELLNGKELYYELATPIEVTFDPAKAFYKVQNGGSEEAVMDGVSAPLVADIAYRDNMAYAEEAALLAFANERSGQNDADLGDAIRTLSE